MAHSSGTLFVCAKLGTLSAEHSTATTHAPIRMTCPTFLACVVEAFLHVTRRRRAFASRTPVDGPDGPESHQYLRQSSSMGFLPCAADAAEFRLTSSTSLRERNAPRRTAGRFRQGGRLSRPHPNTYDPFRALAKLRTLRSEVLADVVRPARRRGKFARSGMARVLR